LGGTAANFKVAALFTRSKNYTISYDTVGNRVVLIVSSSGTAANLVWGGDAVNGTNNVWDINTTPNWLNGVNRDVYYDGDLVNFTDLGATNQLTLDVVVNPGSVNFNSSSNYNLTTLTGAGNIAGPGSVTDGGSGTVTVTVTNTYTGGTIVTNGVFQPGVAQALGIPAGTTPLVSVSGNGTFNINGLALDALYTNAIVINGNGVSPTQGVIDNNAGGLTTGGGDVGIGTLTLAGNSTVSATANWQVGNSGLGIVGNGYTLTKIGGNSTVNYLYLRTNSVSALGNFVIAGGGVLFWDHANSVGLTTPITLTNGGTIDTWNPASQYAGLTFYNPIIVSDPVNSGWILNRRLPYNHPPADVFNGPITLNGPLTFSNVAFVAANQYNNNQNTYGKITVNGNIGGTNGVVVLGGTQFYLPNGYQGGNSVVFNGNNSYTGGTLVTNLIQLFINTANQSGGAYDVVDNATLDVAVAPGNPTIPMSSLVLDSQNIGPGNLSFTRLTSMPANPVIYATNFTVVAGGGFIIPPVAGYSVGQFPLIKYSGSIGGAGFGGLSLATPPAGVSATLVDNAANHSVDLAVTTTGVVWTGNVSSNWDTGTLNWNNPVSPGATTYQDGQTVIFNDTASDFLVNLAQVVQPGGVTVSAANNYTFSNAGGGSINGSAALIKNGAGTLTVACTNNNFTGGTFINGGTVKLADTNYVFPYGGGALNNNLGNVTVANGGSLDINAVQVPNFQSFGPDGYNVYISGSGVGGNGALVNNNTNNNDNADAGYLTLVGDATVGGIGDINIRHGVSPQLSSQSGNYTLTKVGPDQFRVRYLATVSTNFGPINILQGIVSYESSSALGMGDPTKPIYVGSGGGFAWGTAAANCVRPLICSNNSTLYGYNIANNVFNSLITLVSGNVTLSANFYDGMIFSNVISGSGGITLQFQSLATLAASNTYSGNTVVADSNTGSGTNNGSVLKLAGNGSINNSAQIWLQGITASQALPGALDVRGRVDGTLTLANQTLRGDNGSFIRGNVVANSGAIITPGGTGNIQSMICSNNLTLSAGSTVTAEVDLDTGISNDVITVVGTNNYAGTLQLSNLGVTALTNGAAFKLFNNAHFSGTFANITGSPGSGLNWSFNPTNGVATVVASSIVPTVSPKITGFSLSGANVVLNGTNGVNGGTYYLLESTNLTLPLPQWIPVATNVISVSGVFNSFSLTETNAVNLSAKQQFYILSNTN
jgi:autotransporter-associated beta strand protein